MKKTSPIRDIVHDYIATTDLELSIIDSRDFQRLRFVLQNSACYLTYPCNNSSRFTHSLGVMHLSGTLFVRALKNADETALIHFLQLANKIFHVHLLRAGGKHEAFEDPWLKRLGNASRFFHNPTIGERIKSLTRDCLITEDTKTAFNPEFLINTLWQAVRLGALVHDLGHLPMSHIFEKAIGNFRLSDDLNKNNPTALESHLKEFKGRLEKYIQYWDRPQREEYGVSLDHLEGYTNKLSNMHETRGMYILEKILAQDDDKYSRLIISLTRDILISKTKDHELISKLSGEDREEKEQRNFYRSLHSIFASSFIDADRLDYTIRDAKVSGLEHGTIDSKRIVDSIALFEDDNSFKFSFDVRALSAIEFFFHQRYLLYKNLIHHHNALRMDGIVMVILTDLMKYAYNKDNQPKISAVLNNHGFFVPDDPDSKFLPEEYEEKYDDGWLRVVFTDVLIAISNTPNYKKNEGLYRLHLYLETFLYRKTCNVFSFWKRESDRLDFYLESIQKVITELKLQNVDHDKTLIKLLEYMRNKKISKPGYHEMIEATQKEINEEISKMNANKKSVQVPNHVNIVYRHVKPAIFSESGINGYIRIEGKEESRLNKVSPYLKELLTLSSTTPVYYIFFVADGIKAREKNGSLTEASKKLQDICKRCFEKRLKEYLEWVVKEPLLPVIMQQ